MKGLAGDEVKKDRICGPSGSPRYLRKVLNLAGDAERSKRELINFLHEEP